VLHEDVEDNTIRPVVHDKEEGRAEFRRQLGKAISGNLERLRAESGLSQEDLSLRATLGRNHVHLIENGLRFPQLDTVYRLAGALGVEPIELLKGFYWQPSESGGDGRVTHEPPGDEA
jgi:transcriptional regulator with XRE-family HTH domain